MIVRMDIEYSQFAKNCNILISKIPQASKTVMEKAGNDIMELSRSVVPVHTDTLRETAYYRVEGNSKFYELEVGYADAEHDKMNPVTKKMASTYAVAVHEDLLAGHDHGSAKFLSNAVAYWAIKYPRLVKEVYQQLGLV